MVDQELKRWATPLQAQAIDAVLSQGSSRKASKLLGISYQAIDQRIATVVKAAARAGYSPQHNLIHPVAPGQHLKGASSLYRRGESEPLLTWVKSSKDFEDQKTALLEAFRDVELPTPKLIRPPKTFDREWLNVLPIGDLHLGMLAWHLETGEDFDSVRCANLLHAAAGELIETAPPAEEALIINLGDFFHSDTPANVTARSKHPLDVDSRWAKIIRAGVAVAASVIEQALTKHQRVRVWNNIGNHDDQSAIWLGLCLENRYRNEPRVLINESPNPFTKHRFGTNLIASTHGHMCKASMLGAVMACDWKEDWGQTVQRKWYTGHVHHDSLKEYPGVDVETFRTTSGRDMWHHSSGYRSRRDMKCDSWHVTKGLKKRSIVSVEELQV